LVKISGYDPENITDPHMEVYPSTGGCPKIVRESKKSGLEKV
jgi:hypothetical protein